MDACLDVGLRKGLDVQGRQNSIQVQPNKKRKRMWRAYDNISFLLLSKSSSVGYSINILKAPVAHFLDFCVDYAKSCILHGL